MRYTVTVSGLDKSMLGVVIDLLADYGEFTVTKEAGEPDARVATPAKPPSRTPARKKSATPRKRRQPLHTNHPVRAVDYLKRNERPVSRYTHKGIAFIAGLAKPGEVIRRSELEARAAADGRYKRTTILTNVGFAIHQHGYFDVVATAPATVGE